MDVIQLDTLRLCSFYLFITWLLKHDEKSNAMWSCTYKAVQAYYNELGKPEIDFRFCHGSTFDVKGHCFCLYYQLNS